MTSVSRSAARSGVAFWALAGLALLASHDLTFLVQVGPGAALTRVLREAGHDYWGVASAALLATAVVVAAGAIARLVVLRRRAASLAVRVEPPWRRTYARRVAATWLRLGVVVAIGFVAQENVEHALTHGHTPGMAALLGPEYPLALPVIATITFLSAVIASLVATVDAAFVAAIATARLALRRAPRRHRRPVARAFGYAASPIARAGASRAPPVLLVPV